jgi:hypothetical protein
MRVRVRMGVHVRGIGGAWELRWELKRDPGLWSSHSVVSRIADIVVRTLRRSAPRVNTSRRFRGLRSGFTEYALMADQPLYGLYQSTFETSRYGLVSPILDNVVCTGKV